MKTQLILLFLSLPILSFCQYSNPENKKLLKIDERRFLGISTYKFYNWDYTNKLNSFELLNIYKQNNTIGSTNTLRKSLGAKIGRVALVAIASLLPQTKKVPSNSGGYSGTITEYNNTNFALRIVLSVGGSFLYDYGRRLKRESVEEFNYTINRRQKK